MMQYLAIIMGSGCSIITATKRWLLQNMSSEESRPHPTAHADSASIGQALRNGLTTPLCASTFFFGEGGGTPSGRRRLSLVKRHCRADCEAAGLIIGNIVSKMTPHLKSRLSTHLKCYCLSSVIHLPTVWSDVARLNLLFLLTTGDMSSSQIWRSPSGRSRFFCRVTAL